ncbi:TonB-dependent siderophore receptor [Flavobacterium sangjuense]|uniref:Fe(3+)-pyochelin receptor n=1 Tax=Flavobacterium sangjuense TaxID=2518177 RepID=A0A4P7PTX4_9FLAO|nr:TonB-dependent receptor [Flavobacterium sangjuense]QBZ98359.1 Fe(3+)-pyochelin receptor [Flavobacterium sangjuense]
MYRYITILALTLTTSAVGFAQESNDDFQDELYAVNDTVKNKKGEALKEVVIISQQQKTVVKGGKANIKPLDLPQASMVIGKETIMQQQILRLSDALKNANGIYVAGASNASGNNQEELGSRGFTFSGANTFKNGVRFNGSLIPETASLESIEILKGSSALLYGNVAPGGILNLITKKPRFNHGGELSIRTTEYNFFKPTIDVYGAVNNSNTVAYRFISSYEQGNSFRDDVQTRRIYFNPSFLFDISAKTNILVEADYTSDNRTPDFGLATIDYKVVELPRNSFLGFDWGKFDSEQVGFTSTINHDLNKNWQLKGIFSYQGYSTDLLSSLRPNAGINDPNNANNNLVRANGDWIRGVQKTDSEQDYSLVEADLTGTFNTGKMKHTLLFGADADQSNTVTLAYKNINYYDKINIYNPNVILAKNPTYANTLIPSMDKNTNTLANVKRAGVYFQDLIEVTQKVKVLAGLRYSYLENTSEVFTYSSTPTAPVVTETHDNIFSPKLGLVFQPTKNNSVFASYSDSFVLNTGTDRNLKALPNSRIDQYEVGIKNEFFKGHLVANLTTYLIDYGNLAQTDFSNGNTNTNIKELAGAYQSKGVELDITGHHKGLRLIAGYSFNETKYTKSNIYDAGTHLRFSPKHTANASAFYTFENTKLKGFEFGLQSTFIGERLGGRLRPNNASTAAEMARKPIPVDGFLQFDASVGYSIKDFSIRARLSNLANVVSYYVYDDNTVTPIAPRMLTTTVSYKF